MMGPPAWASRWVGLPFAADDAEPGCHCWGLVRRVLAERCGIALATYAEVSATDLRRAARLFAAASGPWRPVTDAARPLDVVLMSAAIAQDARAPVHCGLLVTSRHVLHVEELTRSVIVPRDHWSIARRILSIHRHEALA